MYLSIMPIIFPEKDAQLCNSRFVRQTGWEVTGRDVVLMIRCLWIVGDFGYRTVQLAEDKEGRTIKQANSESILIYFPDLSLFIGPITH